MLNLDLYSKEELILALYNSALQHCTVNGRILPHALDDSVELLEDVGLIIEGEFRQDALDELLERIKNQYSTGLKRSTVIAIYSYSKANKWRGVGNIINEK